MKIAVAALAWLPVCALAQDEMHPLSAPIFINGIAPPHQVRGPGWNCWKDIRSSVPTKFGVTVVAYKVAANGSIKDMTLEKSSGSASLDQRILTCAAEARFNPATMDGRVVEYPEKIRFDWGWNPKS